MSLGVVPRISLACTIIATRADLITSIVCRGHKVRAALAIAGRFSWFVVDCVAEIGRWFITWFRLACFGIKLLTDTIEHLLFAAALARITVPELMFAVALPVLVTGAFPWLAIRASGHVITIVSSAAWLVAIGDVAVANGRARIAGVTVSSSLVLVRRAAVVLGSVDVRVREIIVRVQVPVVTPSVALDAVLGRTNSTAVLAA